ncbi:hypothetical protein [Actinomadura bangladeshensis]|uniref:Uncharacterized protein n=1 Tax=Actinomadura bangladeshensis TaxID=453573 RepID=A0A4R4P6V6_9ACTN|nr:hypothetical protein [Actinomadura bangladeshensis]TDC17875.1 hypothetical protein E1284_07765 [Actinomadura bangladeshensis]
MEEYLLKALLSVVAMLEDAAKFGMDSHAAVNALENVGFELDQMNEAERQKFAEILERVAASVDPAQRDWVRSVP